MTLHVIIHPVLYLKLLCCSPFHIYRTSVISETTMLQCCSVLHTVRLIQHYCCSIMQHRNSPPSLCQCCMRVHQFPIATMQHRNSLLSLYKRMLHNITSIPDCNNATPQQPTIPVSMLHNIIATSIPDCNHATPQQPTIPV